MSGDSREFATEPVPDHRTVGWLRVGLISAMVAFSLPTFVAGVEIVTAVSANRAVLSLFFGSLLLTIIGCITGSIGARTRLSSYMMVRIAFGDRGASLVNLAFALSLLGWFGVNIDLFSDAVTRLFGDVFGVSVNPLLVELAAGLVMTITTVYGFRAINTLSMLLVPVLMLVTAVLISTSLDVRPINVLFAERTGSSISLGDAISSVVGTVIVGAVILPDITRFIRQWRGAIFTAALSYLVIGFIVMSAGGLAAAALANDHMLDIMIVMGLGWAAFAIVIAGSWVLNSLNLYSTMLSVEATLPKLNHRLLVTTLGTLGTAAAFLNILDYFLTFLFYLAIVFVPVAGVIATDYVIVRRSAYHADRIAMQRPYAPLAIAAWAAGALVALLGAEGIVSLSGIAAVDAMLISATVYLGLARWWPGQ
ncbi:MAG: purine-cytosine permease family protein [Woeseia sp.]